MVSKNNICGVVVLYHPTKDVLSNIQSYINQIDFLFVVDNTDSGSEHVKNEILKFKNIEYIENGDNLGVSTALNIGALKGQKLGYSYILTMDQDSKAPDNMISDLFKFIIDADYNLNEVGIISPFHNSIEEKKLTETFVEDRLLVHTSGNLLNLKAYKETGKFCEALFIDRVDSEYCLRLKSKGYKVLRVNNIIMDHNLGKIGKALFLNRWQYFTNHSPLRRYYITRNTLYLIKKFGKMFPEYVKIEKNFHFYDIIKIILFEKEKFKKLKMILKGVIDYRKGITGKFNYK